MGDWDNPVAMLSRARAAQSEGDPDMAHQLYTRACDLDPQIAQAWQGRAETTSLPDEALVSYAYAAALQPDDVALRTKLDAAIAERTSSASPSEASLLIALGQELAYVGLQDYAHTLFARAAELDPQSVDALVWLAGAAGDPQAARQALRKAALISPDDARVAGGLAAFDSLPAETLSKAAVEAAELIRLGDEALEEGDRRRAFELYSAATDLTPDNEAAWVKRARAADDLDEEIRSYDRALAINPVNFGAREARTAARMRRQRARSAAPSMQKTTAPAAAEPFVTAPIAKSEDQRLRLILIVLVILGIVLLIAGLFLMR